MTELDYEDVEPTERVKFTRVIEVSVELDVPTGMTAQGAAQFAGVVHILDCGEDTVNFNSKHTEVCFLERRA